MTWIKSFFSDSQGNFSITRAIFAAMVLNAIAMGWVVLFREGHVAALTIVSSISSVGIGLKLGQNVSETQNRKLDKETEKQVLNG